MASLEVVHPAAKLDHALPVDLSHLRPLRAHLRGLFSNRLERRLNRFRGSRVVALVVEHLGHSRRGPRRRCRTGTAQTAVFSFRPFEQPSTLQRRCPANRVQAKNRTYRWEAAASGSPAGLVPRSGRPPSDFPAWPGPPRDSTERRDDRGVGLPRCPLKDRGLVLDGAGPLREAHAGILAEFQVSQKPFCRPASAAGKDLPNQARLPPLRILVGGFILERGQRRWSASAGDFSKRISRHKAASPAPSGSSPSRWIRHDRISGVCSE